MRFITLLLLTSLSLMSHSALAEINKGDKLQLLVNLHPDMHRKTLYTINYQLPSMMPMCAEINVKKISKKAMIFNYKDQEYRFLYDKHTRGAGKTFKDYLNNFFGKQCESEQIKKLSKADQDGIRTGKPSVGMSKTGIKYAMGRPPIHANPDLDVPTWMYWQNRYKRIAIEFDEKGIVNKVQR